MSPFLRILVLVALATLVTSTQTPPRVVKAASANRSQKDKPLQTRMLPRVTKVRPSCTRFMYGTSKYSKGNFYLMQEQDLTRPGLMTLKYGISVNDPHKRRGQLQTGNPNRIDLLYYWSVQNMGDVENWFKDLLDQKLFQRGTGGKEWFEIPPEEEKQIYKCLTEQIGSAIAGSPLGPPKPAIGRGDLQKEGHIYIISEENALQNCKVKVGATERDPTERVPELQTGNPNRLQLQAYVRVANMGVAETRIHQAMEAAKLRQGITGGTEWFNCESVEKAEKYFDDIKDLIL